MQVHTPTLAELVSDVAQRNGAKPALIYADTPISYADLNTRIERAANGLAASGVAQGDRVALLVPNIPEFVVAYYAILRCGAIVVPINVLFKAEEIAYVLQDSGAKALILFADFAPQGITAAEKGVLSLEGRRRWRCGRQGNNIVGRAHGRLDTGALTSQGSARSHCHDLLHLRHHGAL